MISDSDDSHQRTYLGRVAVRKEIAVNLLEFFHAQVSARAVLEESFVPFLDLGVCNQQANAELTKMTSGGGIKKKSKKFNIRPRPL